MRLLTVMKKKGGMLRPERQMVEFRDVLMSVDSEILALWEENSHGVMAIRMASLFGKD